MVAFQTPDEFLRDFTDAASHEDRRIVGQTMYFKSGGRVSDEMGRVLLDAAGRGVDVTWGVDHYIHDFPDTILKRTPRPFRRLVSQELAQRQENDAMFREFQENGIHTPFTRIGRFRSDLVPFAGRVHSKFDVVGDTSWVLEANLDDRDFSYLNGAMKFTDPAIADALVDYASKIHNRESFDDYAVTIGDNYTFYADAGKPGKSLIQKETAGMFQGAKHDIYWSTQFPPTGAARKELLKKAKEGVQVHILASDDCKGDKLKEFADNPNVHVSVYPGKVHAKSVGIDLDLEDGQEGNTEALFTSHNFHPAGVIGGTGEIAIRSNDQAFTKPIKGFFASAIAGSNAY